LHHSKRAARKCRSGSEATDSTHPRHVGFDPSP
jgi:hypothetical protein